MSPVISLLGKVRLLCHQISPFWEKEDYYVTRYLPFGKSKIIMSSVISLLGKGRLLCHQLSPFGKNEDYYYMF